MSNKKANSMEASALVSTRRERTNRDGSRERKIGTRRTGKGPLALPATTRRASHATAPAEGARRTLMEVGRRIPTAEPLRDHLRRRVIGQDDAIEAIVASYARLLSGLRDPSRPLITALFLGPTGVGKTETGRALAEALFGSDRAMTRIYCEEYAHGHEISKLLGSPPGYVGSDIEPLLSQARIDAPHRELRETRTTTSEPLGLIDQVNAACSEHRDRLNGEVEATANTVETPAGIANKKEPADNYSIVLFDEIEKAHPVLWNSLLGILEDGVLTLGNNSTTDFTRSIILMTSNVGSREMGLALQTKPVGFLSAVAEKNVAGQSAESHAADTDLGRVAMEAARAAFPIEFLNRFDETLVYATLQADHLEAIFDKFLEEITARAMRQAGVPLLIKVADEAKAAIIEHGTDPLLGARPLRRAMEHDLVDPLSRLLVSGQVVAGDVVEVDLKSNGDFGFYRYSRESQKVVA